MRFTAWACASWTRAFALETTFTVIALPDTQYYSKYAANAPIFTNQTQWIAGQVKNGNPRNIVFVSHLGDVVNDGFDEQQWERANSSLSVLGLPGDSFIVPFSILPGNHDFLFTGAKSTGAQSYLHVCGPSRFKHASFYGGSDSSGLNSFQMFSAGGFHFLHIALEWAAGENIPVREPSPLHWASQVILDHPTMPVILSTHEYINDEPAGRSEIGNAIFDALVRSHDQIFLVLCGHYHNFESGGENRAARSDGQWHQVSVNNFGRPVIEVLQDYQDHPHGGNGWLRMVTFDMSRGLLIFDTFSTVLGQYATDTVADSGQRASAFEIPLDFESRLRSPTTNLIHRAVSGASARSDLPRQSFLKRS